MPNHAKPAKGGGASSAPTFPPPVIASAHPIFPPSDIIATPMNNTRLSNVPATQQRQRALGDIGASVNHKPVEARSSDTRTVPPPVVASSFSIFAPMDPRKSASSLAQHRDARGGVPAPVLGGEPHTSFSPSTSISGRPTAFLPSGGNATTGIIHGSSDALQTQSRAPCTTYVLGEVQRAAQSGKAARTRKTARHGRLQKGATIAAGRSSNYASVPSVEDTRHYMREEKVCSSYPSVS
ncbi:hypothetical protein BV25DRAFT_1919977 [Artomyces pyxidatus]|uniref:Uncharacterized protein n=1 Tax=Artomyces pyxidatus TaxID=48021 RepID=A0ACB8SP31_9AGAM|nr:hypothetical protein BV25DRAFT_1919977 [Artomyces pyxidatus]